MASLLLGLITAGSVRADGDRIPKPGRLLLQGLREKGQKGEDNAGEDSGVSMVGEINQKSCSARVFGVG